ncbi:MAG: TIGR03936 family radical SAM-associated protein [Candidatus Omnitrophica bacterium]|nr:TIGR03936 family radical SAM-associated protein [Candidatus Omnitrophota bacterium]MDD5352730.1 TIGR03936 family radical SAM-associated protein [Candidatus Omnitrophota bacterium]MDD5550329.1 TIGR03936 family radical SAM-associated protein [Candidatus Omnitrophota bacterium]
MIKKDKSRYFKFNFIFSKTGAMSYISHLDLIRLFMRAARRANLPLYFTEGFSPRPKLRINRALKLGLESENEEAEILLIRRINPCLFQNQLNRQLPRGIRIREVKVLS